MPLAPLHEPHNLAPIRMAMSLNPELPQVACFDTAFHRTAPEVDQAFALPYSFYEEGIRRYGFHGLSYEYIASVLPERAPEIASGRVVVAHLGNGCSACAMRDRVSIATTMGFTALDGLPMGTRCGELDAGVVLYLIQQKGMSPDELVDLLYKRSGMLGLSGISSDFRELLASDNPRARFARRGVLQSRRPPYRFACRGARRPRRDRLHRRRRRECGAGAQRDLPRLRLAGARAGRGGQPGAPASASARPTAGSALM